MTKLFRDIFLVLALVSVSSCATQGRNFQSKMDWIKKDATRQKDVKLVLNDPYSVGNSGGTKTWTYGYYRYRLLGKSFTKELKFYWNPDNTVKHFSFTSSFPKDIKETQAISPID